jgi:hypothetical protein
MRWPQPIRALAAGGESLLDRALCVAGAVLFSQMPEFMQQYLQRLGGHLDEARRQLAQFQHVAAQSGLTLAQLVANTTANADPAVARLGGVMHAASVRVDALASADAAIRHASLLEKPFVFLAHLDPSIARATWSLFKPAVPTTLEGLVYAAVGVVAMLALYHGGVKYPVTRLARARAARRAGVAPART